MNEIPTVKVIAATPLGYAIINESDYDENIHELYERPIPESPESESGLSTDNQEPPSSEPRRRKPRPSPEPGIE